MLRELFGLPPRKDDGDYLRAVGEIQRFVDSLRQGEHTPAGETDQRPHYVIWSLGFLDVIDELEQSVFCTEWLADKIHSIHVECMSAEERADYRRFVYFYKNGLIRIFSLLDKLGYFLNEWFELETEKIKEHFSYFTVLRNMHENRSHPALQRQLYELKTSFKEPLAELRKQRNMEIHYVNADMLDDWMRTSYGPGDKLHVEDLKKQSQQLRQGYEMSLRTLLIVYSYLNERGEGRS